MFQAFSSAAQQFDFGTAPSSKAEPTGSKHLNRFVFDDLFEHDLLGFLLSSRHFAKYLQRLALRLDPFTARQINHLVCDSRRLQEFHSETLDMYVGVHIAECKHTSHAALMSALDEKIRQLEVGDEIDLVVASNDQNSVELAWLYRKACDQGNSILPAK